tara:strand:- start:503 stop:868 length:366 start_codon:yes stop_codon:yes gene_type:complete
MIVFLIGSMLIFEDVNDAAALPDIRVSIDINNGLSSICTCPEQGCDDSACRFSSDGLTCTGTCSAGELLCELEDLSAPAAQQSEQSTTGAAVQSCMSACVIESKSHHAQDYDAWLERALSR